MFAVNNRSIVPFDKYEKYHRGDNMLAANVPGIEESEGVVTIRARITRKLCEASEVNYMGLMKVSNN